MNSITAGRLKMKALEQLLISSIEESERGELNGWTDKLKHAKAQFEVEGAIPNKSQLENVTAWLQGLPSGVNVPYMNNDILDFYNWYFGRDIKENEGHKLCNDWFEQLAKTLIFMWGQL
jgi:hypothetical protein